MTGEQTLRIRVYDSLDALQELLPAWEDLLAAFPAATIFSTQEWLAPWWRAFGQDQNLHVLAFFDKSDRLVGLAPLAIATERSSPGFQLRLLRLMGDGTQDSDNLDLPVRPGYEKAMAAALLDYLKAHATLWDVCRLNTMPSHSPAGRALLDELGKRSWLHYAYKVPWSVLDLPESWDAYLKALSANERSNLNRRLRGIDKKYRVRFSKCADVCELPQYLETLFTLHQKRWEGAGQPGSFRSEARRKFYLEMGREFLKRGWLELWRLDLNETAVATQYCFRYGKTVFLLQEGYDPDYSADSVGVVLRAHVLMQLIASGVTRYDFLGGEDQAKHRWGAHLDHYLNIHLARPWTLGAIRLRSSYTASAAKERVRARVPRWGWATLHWLNIKFRGSRGKPRRS